jgi:dUTP pyrophosphatase
MSELNNNHLTLCLYINTNDVDVKKFYIERATEHNNKFDNNIYCDSGFDLGLPETTTITKKISTKIPLQVCCSMFTSIGIPQAYCLYPRSSIIKTPMRLSNSVGIIDRGYRGVITAVVDKLDESSSITLDKLNRYFQICHPLLEPFKVKIVDSLQDLGTTERGSGGFGSTGL